MARPDLYRAKTEFATELGGVPIVVHAGDLVREGHALLKRRADLFEPYEPIVRFDTKPVTRVTRQPIIVEPVEPEPAHTHPH